MYSVSNDYLDKLFSTGVKRRKIRGNIGLLQFTEDDILSGSFGYSDIAVSSSDIKLGGVFISTLKLTFLSSFSNRIQRGTWRGREIECEIGLYLGLDANEQEIWEYVPLKPYTIDEANHSALGVDVVAYDYMSRFDQKIIMNTSSGNLYGFAVLACAACDVDLGMTAEEFEALPNGTYTLGLYPENDVETWRDLISWIAVTIGGFATINRDGELVFRNWSQTPVLEIDRYNRFTGGSWSDFETNYTAITVTNIEDGSQAYYAVEEDTGLTLDIGANPLLQYGTDEVVANQRRAILSAIQTLKYVPFKSTSFIDPCLDLGDVIAYVGGLADTRSLCCVMRIDFTYAKGVTLQGYGKNPAENGARSKTDKAISAAASGSKAQGLTYYTYVNTTAVSLTTTAQRLYRITFATNELTTVDLWHEVKWNITTDNGDPVVITYEYYLDGIKFDYEPVETWGFDGYNTMPHPYWLLDVTAGETHTWEVKAKLNGGSAVASIGDIHAELKGQKLVGQVKFDGNLEIYDEYTPFTRHKTIIELVDTAVISKIAVNPSIIALDNYAPYTRHRTIITLADNMLLTAQAVQYVRTLENEDTTRVTEDGGTRLTEV